MLETISTRISQRQLAWFGTHALHYRNMITKICFSTTTPLVTICNFFYTSGKALTNTMLIPLSSTWTTPVFHNMAYNWVFPSSLVWISSQRNSISVVRLAFSPQTILAQIFLQALSRCSFSTPMSSTHYAT